MTIVIKYISSGIIVLFPILLLTTELILNNKNVDFKIVSLVITNLTGLYPTSLCMYYTLTNQKNMIVEFVPFYFITITSGTYHLCDKINNESVFCIYDIKILRTIDFINSYLCVSTVILYLIKFEYITSYHKQLKYISHIYSSLLITVLCAFYNYNISPIFYILFEFMCFTMVVYANYSKYAIVLNNYYTVLYLMIGIGLELIAYIAYICTVYNNYGLYNYWWIHSYLWHTPCLLGAMFLYEATTMNNVKTPFFVEIYRILTGNSQIITYNYISLNEFGIEMTDINERMEDFQENDDNIYIEDM